MWEKILRIISIIEHLDETVSDISRYGQAAFIIGVILAALYALRTPIMFFVDGWRWGKMREIDQGETEAAEVRAAVDVAVALKKPGEELTVNNIMTAAKEHYPAIVKALREGKKKHL